MLIDSIVRLFAGYKSRDTSYEVGNRTHCASMLEKLMDYQYRINHADVLSHIEDEFR
jgi:hypothetical protein